MKRLFLLFFRVCVCVCARAQNFVPNLSFEDTIACPNAVGQISYSIGWFAACKPSCSPQTGYSYFNECDSTQSFGVPYNAYGYQNAYNGNAYAGIALYNEFINNARGYIEIMLNSSLIQNKKYCVSFYVSQANLSGYSINSIGCLFTTDSFLIDSVNQQIFLVPQIENTDSIITDTMNWVLISGEFTASGGEQFLTIGNFRNDSNTSIAINPGGISSSSIYYIDDVSVTLCNDTTAVEEFQNEDYRLQIYPNPNSGNMQLDYQLENGQIGALKIYDILGQEIKNCPLQNDRNTLKISDVALKNGIYFYEILINDEIINSDKLIIIR